MRVLAFCFMPYMDEELIRHVRVYMSVQPSVESFYLVQHSNSAMVKSAGARKRQLGWLVRCEHWKRILNTLFPLTISLIK